MPEEINRVLTDHVADLPLAPTEAAVANLTREGLLEPRVHLCGDVMYDAALLYAEVAAAKSCGRSWAHLTPYSRGNGGREVAAMGFARQSH